MTGEHYSTHAARQFADKYKDVKSEKQFDQSFWRDLFTNVCGIDDLLSVGIEFQFPVRSQETGTIKFIDALWPTVVLVEHKSAGENLDKAYKQATEYWISLPASHRPPHIIVSDFKRIRIVHVDSNEAHEFLLTELPDNLDRLQALIGSNGSKATRIEVAADTKAAELMGQLFSTFEAAGYTDQDTSVFLVRILFLMFGDDTRMWPRPENGLFGSLVNNSALDGTGLGATIQELFQVLDTPVEKRPATLPESLRQFPYVNGSVFSSVLPIFSFTKEMRQALIDACNYSWQNVNVSVFGSLFQSVRDPQTRREMGEHYTSETNILRTISDLFLNDLHKQLGDAWDSPTALKRFRTSLATYRFADFACGSGNFLTVAYKRLRDIELRVIARQQELEGNTGQLQIDGSMGLSVHLSQFTGVEIDEWSASIAHMAMFLADHQANLALEEITGATPNRFPLKESANIITANALRLDWESVFEFGPNSFIMGNPPFFGYSLQTAEQRADTEYVWGGVKGAGVLDFVTNWYRLAAKTMAKHGGRAALVSTSSITQGEQPAIIWGELFHLGMSIDFAHRTFSWTNDAQGQAAVHVVIIGFSGETGKRKKNLWEYSDPKGQPTLREVPNINPYLLAAKDIVVASRTTPLNPNTPRLDYGSKPTDGGFLSNISPEEASKIRTEDEVAAKYLRRIIGAQELIHNEERWCLWLVGANPADMRSSRVLSERIGAVREYRAKSTKAKTRDDASRAHEFQEIRAPKKAYAAVPQVSSENRDYVPVAWFESDVMVNNSVSIINGGDLATFGMLVSRPFSAWNKAVSGRLESRLRISSQITYNNFPFPELEDESRKRIEVAAQAVLDARAIYTNNTLADLYDPNAMPTELSKAHKELDKIVLAAFGLTASADDEKILERLFDLYSQAVDGLLYQGQKVKKK
jgi:hypothetical protein